MSPLKPLKALLTSKKKPLVAAHRGASGYAPENTVAAFNLALKMGADAIELDVHLSKDGVPVIIHDPRLERTTSGTGLVYDHTVQELKEFDTGSWFDPAFAVERMLTLEETLQWARGKTSLLIEIKNSPMKYKGIAEKVLTLAQKHGMTKYVEVFSFDHNLSLRIRKLSPGVLTGVCYAADPITHAALAVRAKANLIHPNVNYCTPKAVSEAHKKGLWVAVWTVNDTEIAQRLAELGVDIIKTDFPDKIKGSL